MSLWERFALHAEFACKLWAASSARGLKAVASALGINIATASRYLHGRDVPSPGRARELLSRMPPADHRELVRSCLCSGPLPFPHVNNLLSSCPQASFCVLHEMAKRLEGVAFDAVVTAEGGGLPFAFAIALASGKPLVYGVKDVKVVGGYAIARRAPPAYAEGPRVLRYLTFPLGLDLRGKSAVVVDGVAWTGQTALSMKRYVESRRGSVSKVLLVAASRGALERLSAEAGCPVEAVVEVEHRRAGSG